MPSVEESRRAAGDFQFSRLSSRGTLFRGLKLSMNEMAARLITLLVSPSMLILVATLLSVIQLIGIPYDYGEYAADIQESLGSRNVGIIAGFSIGYISPVLIDLLVDAYQGLYELWISRSFYFILSVVYAIIVLVSPFTQMAGRVYIIYGSAAMIFFTGRTFVDLCIHDSTHTWTVRRCMVLLSLLSVGQLTENLSKTTFGAKTSFSVIGTAISLTYAVLIMIGSILSAYKILRKYSGPSILYRLGKATHEESITVLISLTMLLTVVAFLILPVASGGFNSEGSANYRPAYICGDLMIKTYFASTCALIPSVIMKLKAHSLQNDLDLKSLFVRNVAHEIR